MKLKDWDDREQDKKQGTDRAGFGGEESPENDGPGGDDEWKGMEADEDRMPEAAGSSDVIDLTKQRFRKFSLNPEDEDSESSPEKEPSSPDPKIPKGSGAPGSVGAGKGRRPEEEDDEAWEEEDWEELPPLKPWAKVLIFLGLAVLAAAICAVLWHFVHPDKPSERGSDSLAQTTQTPEEDGSRQPDLDLPEAPVEEAGADMTPDSTPNPEDGTGMGPAGQADTAPGTESEDQTGTAPDGQDGSESGGQNDAGAGQESETVPSGNPEQPDAQAPAESENQEPVSGNADMKFGEVKESVTPKDVVNLRSVPTTTDAENIVTQARNGETLTRIGVNDSTGWSKIDYNGQILYAVTQYLTTDLSYKPPVKPSDPNRVSTISGRIIIFKDCDDWISPKEYVNLRTEPSTTEGNATVSCQLNYGEKAHRTGYSTDSGWSRVEYDGQVLYVVTSLMYEVSEE